MLKSTFKNLAGLINRTAVCKTILAALFVAIGTFCAITYTAQAQTYTVTVVKQYINAGIVSVTENANASNTSATSITVNEDEEVTLTVTVNSDVDGAYIFEKWSADGGTTSLSTSATFSDYQVTANVTITACFTLKDFDITYHLDGAANNAGNPATYTIEDENITLGYPTGTPTGKDWAFYGWFKDDGLTTPISVITKGSYGDLDIYARWYVILTLVAEEPGWGTVTGGGGIFSVYNAVTSVISADIEATPETYYEFVNWTDEEDVEISTTASHTENLTKNTTLTANFAPIEYTIEFDSKGGTDLTALSLVYTIEDLKSSAISFTDVVDYEEPENDGYTFAGWFTDDVDFDVEITSISTGNIADLTDEGTATTTTLYAKWEPIGYTITYLNMEGATNHTDNPGTYHAGDLPITLEDPTKIGYAFGGWYDDDAFSGSAITTIAAGSTGNKTFYAKWTKNDYTLTYSTNGGDAITALTYTVDNIPIILPTPTKTGYEFVGWFIDNTTSLDEITSITLENIGDMEIYAKWGDAITYSITYNHQTVKVNTTITNANPTEYTVTGNITLTSPTRNGYTFSGWFANAELTGSAITTIATGSTGNKTFWGKWEPTNYNITYNLNDGDGTMLPVSYNIDQTPILLPTPTPTVSTKDYFIGWYDKNDPDLSAGGNLPHKYILTNDFGNKTFYAIWDDDPLPLESGPYIIYLSNNLSNITTASPTMENKYLVSFEQVENASEQFKLVYEIKNTKGRTIYKKVEIVSKNDADNITKVYEKEYPNLRPSGTGTGNIVLTIKDMKGKRVGEQVTKEFNIVGIPPRIISVKKKK